MASLVENSKGLTHCLHPVNLLGADPRSAIRVQGPGVLPEHARIHLDLDHFVIEPSSRDALVLVNGRKSGRKVLEEGDTLRIGECEFRFTFFDRAVAGVTTEKRADILRSMHDFSRTLMQAEELPPLLNSLLDRLLELTRADKGFVVIREEGEYRIKASRCLQEGDLAAAEDISRNLVRAVVEGKRPVRVTNAPSDTRFGAAQSIVDLKLHSLLAVPLMLENEVFGLIYAGSEKSGNLFDAEDEEVMTLFAAQAALILRHFMKVLDLREENRNLKSQVAPVIVYQSAVMENVMRLVDKVAPTDMAVLVLGETGTGKELVAAEIHRKSRRSGAPFVTVNCSAIPENLVESELFGHMKGSFTGAHADRKGKFELADNGTLFLDEVGDLPAPAQAKLLRVLESGEIETVGALLPRRVDVRVVAATHKDLKAGGFREDLYYRLCGVEVKLPPLRERQMDALYIARALLEAGGGRAALSKAAETALLRYPWPGNVRELRNRVLRAVALVKGRDIEPSDLELGEGEYSKVQPLNEAKERFARDYIRDILVLNANNKSAAARDLGVDVRTIYRYLEEG